MHNKKGDSKSKQKNVFHLVAPEAILGCFLRVGWWCPLADLTVLSESMSSLNKAQHLSNIPSGQTLDGSLAMFVYLTLCACECLFVGQRPSHANSAYSISLALSLSPVSPHFISMSIGLV